MAQTEGLRVTFHLAGGACLTWTPTFHHTGGRAASGDEEKVPRAEMLMLMLKPNNTLTHTQVQ